VEPLQTRVVLARRNACVDLTRAHALCGLVSCVSDADESFEEAYSMVRILLQSEWKASIRTTKRHLRVYWTMPQYHIFISYQTAVRETILIII